MAGRIQYTYNANPRRPVAPGAKITVSCWGVEDDAGNQITSYDFNVYIVTEDQYASGNYSLYMSATRGPREDFTFEIPAIRNNQSTRGKWIFWTAQPTGLDFPIAKSGYLINTLPQTTKIEVPEVAPVYGGQLLFKCTPGQDSDTNIIKNIINNVTMDTHSLQIYYYEDKTNIQRKLVENNFYLPVEKGTDDVVVYIGTYDGIEYNEPAKVIVKRNNLPLIKSLNATPITFYVIPTPPTNTQYAPSVELQVVFSEGSQHESGVGIRYNYGFEYADNFNFTNFTVGPSFIEQYPSRKIRDIRSHIMGWNGRPKETFIRYYIEIYNQNEHSNRIYSDTIFWLPPKPQLLRITNVLNGASKASSLSNVFYNDVCLTFELDDGYNGIRLKQPLSSNISCELVKNVTSQEMYVNISNLANFSIEKGKEFLFNVGFLYNDQEIWTTNYTNTKLTQIKFPQLSISNDYNTLRTACHILVNDLTSLALQIFLTDENGALIDSKRWSEYGISNLYESCFIQLGTYSEKLELGPHNFGYGNEAGVIYYSYNKQDGLFSILQQQPGRLNINSWSIIDLSFSITNDFGVSFKAVSPTGFYVDCREAPIIDTINSPPSFHSFGVEPSALVEKLPFMFTGKFYSYNSNPKILFWIKRDNDSWVPYGEWWTLAKSENREPTPGNPVLYNLNAAIGEQSGDIGKIIRKDYDVKFKIEMISDGGLIDEYEFDNLFIAKEFKPGTITLQKISYSKQDNKFVLKYQINDPGINLKNWATGTIQDDIEIIPKFFWRIDGNEYEEVFSDYAPDDEINNYNSYPYSNIITKEISLPKEDRIIATTFSGGLKVDIIRTTTINITNGSSRSIETTYTTLSPEVTIYNEYPTVSYRKNQLGINTDQPTSWPEGVLVISAADSTKKKIFLINPETPDGDSVISIDLVKGTIDGAIIDGGTW